jgi:proline iminopeptidase
VCDALGIEAPVVLGNSFGGFVAMHYAAKHPDHPSKLVLASTQARRHRENTAARFEALGGPEARDCYLRIFDGHGTPEDGAEYFQRCMPLYSRTPNPFAPSRSILNLAMMDDSTRWFADFDARDRVGRITAPTLVLAGEDDPMTPVEAAEEIVALLPPGRGRLVRFADCGHGTYRDQPDATERVLRDFLA